MKLKVLAIVLLLLVGGGALFVAMGGLPRGAAAATTYLTAAASVTDVSDDIAATGAVAAATSWNLQFGSAPTTGSSSSSSSSSSSNGSAATGTWHVSTVKVKVGDAVTAKEVLATASNADLAAAITAAKNEVTSAGLQKLLAQEAYDAATATDQIRQTRMSLLGALNAYAQAKTNLKDLQDQADRGSLVAPAAGVVTAVNITAAADAPSVAAITIDAASYQVTADVVETDVPSVKLGQAAAVNVAALNADLTGTVSSIAPTAASSSSSNSVVSYAVTIDLASPPVGIRSGMTASITITTASASGVLAVPAAAIRGTSGNYSVLVLANGTPEPRAVTVGLMTSSLVEIKSGLTEGEAVVIGTSSQQRSSTSGFGGGGGGFVVPGGGGGRGGGPVDVKGGG
jgi:macrolide-specific efflux system membrane fusion protein